MILLDDDLAAGISEIYRASEMGLTGAMISVYPTPGQFYDDPRYETLWAAACDLDMPLSLHVGTGRPDFSQMGGSFADLINTDTFHDLSSNDYWPRMSLSHMIGSGVFERHPSLKVINVEHELGWIPFFIQRMDYWYTERPVFAPHRFKGDALPSDFMRHNVFHSFQEDELGVKMRDMIGVDNLLWGSDYPHAESTFPKSQEILDRIMEGVPEDERAKIVGGNTAQIYKFV